MLRQISFTDNVADLTLSEDADELRRIVLPIAVNYQIEAVEILNTQGVSILSTRRMAGDDLTAYNYSRGSEKFQEFQFVSKVLNAKSDEINDQIFDKYSGWVNDEDGSLFYVSGPIKNENGDLVGAILIGKTVASLAYEMRSELNTEALSIYTIEGMPVHSTYSLFNTDSSIQITDPNVFLDQQEEFSLIRTISVGSLEFSELLGVWETRNGDDLGIIGIARAKSFFITSSTTSRTLIFIIVSLILIFVISIGVFLANRITRPLHRVMAATRELEQGNFDIKVEARGSDEISVLAETFNEMVVGLREGSIYRDLFGRSVSPEIRDAIRNKLASGELLFSGQDAFVSIIFTDIQGFTTISEKTEPSQVMDWLNEYFGIMTPIIIDNNGVINKFIGDALLAFVGLIPTQMTEQDSAYFATRSGFLIQSAINEYNLTRRKKNLPELLTGIGIHSGMVTAGVLGAAERLEFTLIGDTVNTSQRIESLAHKFSETAVMISDSTYRALDERRNEFTFKCIGKQTLKGKAAGLEVYRVLGMNGKP